MSTGTEHYYRVTEVAQRMAVSRATVWRWTTERGLKVVSIGSVTRIRESDLLAFIARHEKGDGAGDTGGKKDQSDS